MAPEPGVHTIGTHRVRTRLAAQRGYSLVETVTAAAVLVITSALAVPNLMSMSANYQLTGSAQQLAFDISRVRMKAIGENVYCRVRLNHGDAGDTYWFERSDDGTTYTADSVVTRLPSWVSFASMPEAPIVFNRMGLATASATIGLSNVKGRSKNVSVSVLGKVTVQ